MMSYLSTEALEGLKTYTYKPGGYTWLDLMHQPLWNWMVNRLPYWLAPNLITLSGLIGVLVTYLLIVFFQPNFTGSSPWWVMVLTGLSVCLYANLDCIDGKQARRTNSSSPLGQLFDHGCDAYIVHLLLADMIACMDTSCGWKAATGSLAVMVPWILAQLEEYHTGVMMYGNGIWGVMEALYSTAGLCFATAVVGTSQWSNTLFFLPSSWNITYVDFAVTVILTAGTIQAGGQLWKIVTHNPSSLSASERGNKQLGSCHALWHLLLVSALLGFGSLWIATAERDVCRLAFTSFGTVYALVSTQLIVAHMAKTPFVPLRFSLSSLIVFSVNSAVPMVDPRWVATFSCLLYNFMYGHYAISVVNQICSYLDIWCLSIKKKSEKQK